MLPELEALVIIKYNMVPDELALRWRPAHCVMCTFAVPLMCQKWPHNLATGAVCHAWL